MNFLFPDEIPHRDMSEIPHPFIIETMDLLDDMNMNRKNLFHTL